MQTTPLAIKYLGQVTDLTTELFTYIVEDTKATNSFISTLIAQGYQEETLLQFHSERLLRSQNLATIFEQSKKALKELQ